MTVSMSYFILGLLIVTLIVIACAYVYNKHKRNQSLALGMLNTTMTAELQEVLKTALRGNKINAPMKFLCRSMCTFMALYDDNDEAIRRMNAHFKSVHAGMSDNQTGAKYPEIYVEMHPNMPHTLRINIGRGGMRWMQDLDNFMNFDILESGLGPTA